MILDQCFQSGMCRPLFSFFRDADPSFERASSRTMSLLWPLMFFSGVFLSHPAIKSIETNTKRALEKSYKNTFFLMRFFPVFSCSRPVLFLVFMFMVCTSFFYLFLKFFFMVCSCFFNGLLVFFSGVCGLLVLLLVLFSWFARTFSRVFFVVCSWFFWFFLKGLLLLFLISFLWFARPFAGCHFLSKSWSLEFVMCQSWRFVIYIGTVSLEKEPRFLHFFSCSF